LPSAFVTQPTIADSEVRAPDAAAAFFFVAAAFFTTLAFLGILFASITVLTPVLTLQLPVWFNFFYKLKSAAIGAAIGAGCGHSYRSDLQQRIQ
jgi:hypothetical protein